MLIRNLHASNCRGIILSCGAYLTLPLTLTLTLTLPLTLNP